jgi:hypothetical protein
MPRIKRDDPAELIRHALISLDTQIAELRETRAQLAAMIDQSSMTPAVRAAEPQKRRKLSAEAREKIRAAVKARWERERKAKTKTQKTPAKKALQKGKPAKARSGPAKAKKGSSESPTSTAKAKARKAT